jgi:hypothetical protein
VTQCHTQLSTRHQDKRYRIASAWMAPSGDLQLPTVIKAPSSVCTVLPYPPPLGCGDRKSCCVSSTFSSWWCCVTSSVSDRVRGQRPTVLAVPSVVTTNHNGNGKRCSIGCRIIICIICQHPEINYQLIKNHERGEPISSDCTYTKICTHTRVLMDRRHAGFDLAAGMWLGLGLGLELVLGLGLELGLRLCWHQASSRYMLQSHPSTNWILPKQWALQMKREMYKP